MQSATPALQTEMQREPRFLGIGTDSVEALRLLGVDGRGLIREDLKQAHTGTKEGTRNSGSVLARSVEKRPTIVRDDRAAAVCAQNKNKPGLSMFRSSSFPEQPGILSGGDGE